jgi:cytochrome b561
MQWINSKTKYGIIPQLFHWLTVLFVLVGWFLGQFGDIFPRGPAREAGLLVHMTLGESILALLLIRLVWRLANPSPPLEPTPLGRALGIAARISHYLLYTLLLAVPVAGIVLQLTRGHPLPVFAAWDVASPWPADRAVARSVQHVHQVLAYALLTLAFIHSMAAVVHHWVWRDRTLVRMLPGET